VGDFDFLVGTWEIDNRTLVERLAGCDQWREFRSTSRCWRMFDGDANVDEFVLPGGRRGMTTRLRDPATGQWSLHWSSNTTGAFEPPVIGGFGDDGVGRFYGDDEVGGRPIRVRYLWSRITPTSCRWEQAFSADGEATWETNWIMDLRRVSAQPAAEPWPVAS
jgi:hypothetical protein